MFLFIERNGGIHILAVVARKKKHVKDFDTLFFFFKLAKYYLGLKWTDKGGILLLESLEWKVAC